jgi:hypothetical protein
MSTSNQDELLIRLLGQQDATFLPGRDPRSATWALVSELRRNFPSAGLPWRGGGQSARAQREMSDALRSLARQNLVTITAGGLAKTTACRLTPRGDETARALAGLCSLSDAIGVVQELLRLEPPPDDPQLPGKWIGEVRLNGGVGWGYTDTTGLQDVENRCLPGLARGWLETNTAMTHLEPDGHYPPGRAFYRATAAGRAAVGTVKPMDDSPDMVFDLNQAYIDEMGRALAKLRGYTGRDREIGQVPLSACTPA